MINKRTDIQYIRNQLMHGGYKLTKQRLQIIDVIYENNRHMNVDAIYREVKSQNIGITTIYRSLMILEEVGVLKKINVSNISYYELEEIDEHKVHIHAKCIKCNKIIDVYEKEITEQFGELIEKLKGKHENIVKSTSVILSEICKECEMKLQIRRCSKIM